MDEVRSRCVRAGEDLLADTLPFWLEHGLDPEHGGVFTCLGRRGELLDTDKSIWTQGRCAWLLATVHSTVGEDERWLAGALSCLQFLERHGFDKDGRMFFLVTADGRPLRKRRYVYSEAFACMAYAACARATGREDWAARARELFEVFTRVSFEPGEMISKVDPRVRPARGFGPLMICLHLAQTLRECLGEGSSDVWIDRCIAEIERDFCKSEERAVMETVAPDGGLLDHFEGRLLNPGHAIEAAWFCLHEARVRGADAQLTELGVRMLDWMWERGWDREYGGLLAFCDLHGKPPADPGHDLKYWWPQTEAIIATFLAHGLSGEARHAERFCRVFDWAYEHFADPEHGEWFGYLHRDGTRVTEVKGNHWKGPFHLPRMQWLLGAAAPGAESLL